MFEANVVNLIQAFSIGIATLSIAILSTHKLYRTVSAFFAMVMLSAIFNLLEELNITRSIHLVTPVFVLGFGPMLYLVVKSLTKQVNKYDILHFVPMLLLLPFTQYTQTVILIGTVWRVIYAGFAVYRIYQFNATLDNSRSDAHEVALRWLGWLIVIMTITNAADLVRLNLQPMLPVFWNIFGQGLVAVINITILLVLTTKLNAEHKILKTLPLQQTDDTPNKTHESAEDYQAIFKSIDQQMRDKQWFLQARLSLSDLSQLTGLQPRDVSRAINLSHQLSFNDYINSFRVEHVKEAMRTSSTKPLLTLAHEAGFSAKSSFNYSFKKQTGMTPSEYRNSLRSNPN
ncbi:helix-turn-helix domain-containing protein [Pseudoalteromonas sp. MMG022]|uniref:helix-turn-helix domain-containing protein n=1 Tax=Pseudoalteromonas sp. MMG022 TaxID=2909978 RepID=UPI001F263B85|nr:helix-turn-helix domain-containing protein [Pseudoalteromonas sp. MMG022]MCF6437095.1 helix-turn-helix domain-containing protein [Pseudoalteromonas sp. MMG022]